jgi:membrane protein YqaA with SNARE-associated domain
VTARAPAAPGHPRSASAGALALAGAWGFAEAVALFIVPDVLLSRLALCGARAALTGCLAATAGALGGGLLVYAAAAGHPAEVLEWLDRVPAVSGAMIERAGRELEAEGSWALARGPLTATPYKIFAAHAGRQGLPIAPFLAASAAARLVRFAVLSLLAVAAAGRLRRAGVGESALRGWHASVWTVFYTACFSLMPG